MARQVLMAAARGERIRATALQLAGAILDASECEQSIPPARSSDAHPEAHCPNIPALRLVKK
jgi:hypothetical protein